METLSSENDLVYKIEDNEIFNSKLFEHGVYNSGTLSIYPGLTQEEDNFQDGLIKLKYKNINFSIFPSQINMNFSDKNIKVKVGSFTHLKLLKEKFNYKNPVFRKISNKEFSPLVNPEKIKDFQFIDEEIIIMENTEENNYYDSYKEFTTIIEKIDIYNRTIKIKNLSLNFKKYFFNYDFIIDTEKEIPIFHSSLRYKIHSDIIAHLKRKEKIYAICGAFGIGKSFTSLIIQRKIYKIYKTLYINLANNEEINQLKDTIIKEIFFLKLDEKDFNSLINKILSSNYNDIWEIIIDIDNYCSDKKVKYLLILDQYQKETDKNENLFNLKVEKIFLLSSINDEDVKDNLVSQIKKKVNSRLNYKYYINLGIQNSYFDYYSKNENNNVIDCAKRFNYLPISFFLLETLFQWKILDFLNFQYDSILKSLTKFYNNVDINHIKALHINNKINNQFDIEVKKVSINLNDFLNKIKYIPLKFISYIIINNLSLELYYAFEYIKKPLDCIIKYKDGLNALLEKNEEGMIKGRKFENVIFYKFILNKSLFDIDGFINVDKIVNMILVDEYKNIDINDLKNKNCVLISQNNFYGEDYDFAVLYPKKGEIILIQAKYKLDNNNVNDKNYYTDGVKISIILNAVLNNLNINLNKIYLLYLSTCEYNNKSSFDILSNKNINCIFYNVTKDYFTMNFKEYIYTYEPSESSEIYPNSKNFTPQIYCIRNKVEELILKMAEISHKDKKNDIINYPNLDKYNDFINYLKANKIENEFIKHLGEFCTNILKEYSIAQLVLDKQYILFFKETEENEINFNDKMFIVYEKSQKLKYYDIYNKKKIKGYSILKNNDFKNFCYIIGRWIDDNIINLDEKNE